MTSPEYPNELYCYKVNDDYCYVDLQSEDVVCIKGNCNLPTAEINAIKALFNEGPQLRFVFHYFGFDSDFPFTLAEVFRDKIYKAAFIVPTSRQKYIDRLFWHCVPEMDDEWKAYFSALELVEKHTTTPEDENTIRDEEEEGDVDFSYMDPKMIEEEVRQNKGELPF